MELQSHKAKLSIHCQIVCVMIQLQFFFNKLNSFVSKRTHIHFLSDGPSTQYHNCKLFKLLGTHIPDTLPSVQTILWNYTEAGHGKGAPDGLGGTLKRTAHSQSIKIIKNEIER
ncbi:hypothetical protein PR048_001761 [Dryococelus australis]|uniref:Uncharacterized protein n=1 Tax=Dryococelus australis TaxID=614101 RepID=A0ABQ9II80_9NEOP|nr:hypothetical protein PR048_001761 [Dryococelus australis]